MSHAEIAFEELSPIEQQHFQLWATEIQAIAAKSKSKGLAKKPPRLVVIRLPQDAGALHASTDGGKLMISRDVLPACPDLRRYFIAHELGHVEGRHPWISFGAAAVAMLPVVLVRQRSMVWGQQRGGDCRRVAIGFVLRPYVDPLFEVDALRVGCRP